MLHRLRPLALLAIGAVLGASASAAHQAWATKPALPWREARLFAEVFERVRTSYVDAISERQLAESAVRGMVDTLDPYSAYLNASEAEELRVNTSGAYAGVGVEISTENEQIKVIAAIDDSPAAHAGIRAGDTIAAIDDIPVQADRLNESVDRMRGKSGTRVKLTVLRSPQTTPLTFNLMRGTVQVHSIKQQLLAPGYGYVRISQFSETTAEDFSEALNQLQRAEPQGLRGLVLDLRNNPGGVLEAATAVADAVLNEGTIVSANGRSDEAQFAMRAQPGDALNGAPMVVLVNGASASAAEIVAGALKDLKRATLMGQNTYGKGSVQTVMPLGDGGALKLTTSHYHTPSGASIHRRGIVPDVVVNDGTMAASPDAQSTSLVREDAEVRMALIRLRGESHESKKTN